MSGFDNTPLHVIESDEHVNRFQDVHRKAKALRNRAHEDRKKLEDLRNKTLSQEAASALQRRDWLVPISRRMNALVEG
jgi:hypothetical protein